MKKKITILICALATIMLMGCETTIKETTIKEDRWGKFTVIERRQDFDDGTLEIIYDNETKVMYYYVTSGSKGGITPIYDENGNIMIYNGE